MILLGDLETLEANSQGRIREALGGYLRDPSPWATLVMISGKGSKLGKGLSPLTRRTAVVNPPKVAGTALAAWVRRALAGAQLEIEPDALEILLQRCREEWTAVEKEMEKIIAAFPPGTRIGTEVLEFVVEPRMEESVFSLLRLLAEGQTGAALEKLNTLLRSERQERDRLLHLWYWLYRQTRELLGTAEAAAQGLGPDTVEAVGINPRAQAILRRQLKNFPSLPCGKCYLPWNKLTDS